MVDLRPRSDTSESHPVDFLVRIKRITCKFDPHITQYSWIIRIVISSVLGTQSSFNSHFSLIIHRFSAQDNTSPISGFTRTDRFVGSKHNRSILSTPGNQFTSRLGNNRCFGGFIPFYDRTCFYFERRTIGNIQPPFHHIYSLGQLIVSVYLHLIRPIAQLSTVFKQNITQIISIIIAVIPITAVIITTSSNSKG